MAEIRVSGRPPRKPQPGDILCIIPGPKEELAVHYAGEKWCFKCRRYTEHDDVLLGDGEPSYYEPIWMCRCRGCRQDHTRFPGR